MTEVPPLAITVAQAIGDLALVMRVRERSAGSVLLETENGPVLILLALGDSAIQAAEALQPILDGEEDG